MRRTSTTINPQLSRIISETGHTDLVVVTDAGLPIPPASERVDLAYRPGAPAFLDVLDTVLAELVVGRGRARLERVDLAVQPGQALATVCRGPLEPGDPALLLSSGLLGGPTRRDGLFEGGPLTFDLFCDLLLLAAHLLGAHVRRRSA